MKHAITVMVILLFFPVQHEADPYSLSIVRRALINNEAGISFGADEKNIPRLGDACAIAILKITDQTYFNDPKKIQAVLRTLRSAFALPENVTMQEDKKPKVTLFLLDYLKMKVTIPELQQEVQKTLEFVKTQTAESHTGTSPRE